MQNERSTKNFYLAAYLKSIGIEVKAMPEKTFNSASGDKRRFVFVFEKTDETDKTINSYYDNKEFVDPLVFVANIKALKEIMYNS